MFEREPFKKKTTNFNVIVQDEGMPSIERLAKVAEEIGGRYKLNKNAKITEFDYTVIRSLVGSFLIHTNLSLLSGRTKRIRMDSCVFSQVKRAFVIGQEGIPRWICALCSTEFPDAVKLRGLVCHH